MSLSTDTQLSELFKKRPYILKQLTREGFNTLGELSAVWDDKFRFKLQSNYGCACTKLVHETVLQFRTEQDFNLEAILLSDKRLGLMEWIAKEFQTRGIETLGDLASVWNEDYASKLLLQKNFGPHSVGILNNLMSNYSSGILAEKFDQPVLAR